MKIVITQTESVYETFAALRSNSRDDVKVWRKSQHLLVPGTGTMHDETRLFLMFNNHAHGCAACEAAKRAPRNAGRGLIWLYRSTLSPLIGFNCRHVPTCSAYGDEAIARFGLWAGGWMTLARLLRCQPWGTSGLDFVVKHKPTTARWYLPWRYARWRGVNDKPE